MHSSKMASCWLFDMSDSGMKVVKKLECVIDLMETHICNNHVCKGT